MKRSRCAVGKRGVDAASILPGKEDGTAVRRTWVATWTARACQCACAPLVACHVASQAALRGIVARGRDGEGRGAVFAVSARVRGDCVEEITELLGMVGGLAAAQCVHGLAPEDASSWTCWLVEEQRDADAGRGDDPGASPSSGAVVLPAWLRAGADIVAPDGGVLRWDASSSAVWLLNGHGLSPRLPGLVRHGGKKPRVGDAAPWRVRWQDGSLPTCASARDGREGCRNHFLVCACAPVRSARLKVVQAVLDSGAFEYAAGTHVPWLHGGGSRLLLAVTTHASDQDGAAVVDVVRRILPTLRLDVLCHGLFAHDAVYALAYHSVYHTDVPFECKASPGLGYFAERCHRAVGKGDGVPFWVGEASAPGGGPPRVPPSRGTDDQDPQARVRALWVLDATVEEVWVRAASPRWLEPAAGGGDGTLHRALGDVNVVTGALAGLASPETAVLPGCARVPVIIAVSADHLPVVVPSAAVVYARMQVWHAGGVPHPGVVYVCNRGTITLVAPGARVVRRWVLRDDHQRDEFATKLAPCRFQWCAVIRPDVLCVMLTAPSQSHTFVCLFPWNDEGSTWELRRLASTSLFVEIKGERRPVDVADARYVTSTAALWVVGTVRCGEGFRQPQCSCIWEVRLLRSDVDADGGGTVLDSQNGVFAIEFPQEPLTRIQLFRKDGAVRFESDSGACAVTLGV